MREYSKIAPQFWTGDTGKKLRSAGMEAQIVALYLMSSPHSNMMGFYYLPKIYIAHETGLGIEGASEGLASCIEADFCSYDEASEHVFVHWMARFQIGDRLDPKDKRVFGLRKDVEKAPKGPLLQRFLELHAEAFCLEFSASKASPIEAPYKPLRSQEQEMDIEQNKKDLSPLPESAGPKTKRASRLAENWVLPRPWGEWALAQGLSEVDVRFEAAQFLDYWNAKSGKDAAKMDWLATWRQWIRKRVRDGASRKNGFQTSSPEPRSLPIADLYT